MEQTIEEIKKQITKESELANINMEKAEKLEPIYQQLNGELKEKLGEL